MSAVLVTGGSGYLATHVIAALLREGRDVRTTVRSATSSDDVRAAVRRGGADDAHLEIIAADLLADDGMGGLVVLDYKTDSVSSEAQVAERTARYRLQAATYALALEEVSGRPVTRAVFLFLSGATARESDVVDLETAKAEVRGVLSRS